MGLFFAAVASVLALSFLACSPNLEQNPRISELRDNILVGQAQGYKVTIVSGMRENPFVIDGKSGEKKADFVVLTLAPDTFSLAAEYGFSVTIAGTKYSGRLLKHPFNNTYSAEIATRATERELAVTISGGADLTVTASSVVGDNFIGAMKAFDIAQKRVGDDVEDLAKTTEYEIFIRLIESPVDLSGGFRWYVAFVFECETTFAVLIDPVSMEILAVKED